MDTQLVLNQLKELEIELHQKNVRNDINRLNELLHESFLEVGRYGKTFRKSDILANIPKNTISGSIWSQDYELEDLSDDLALITYKSTMMDQDGRLSIYTFRSSLWQKVSGSWRIHLHQWTPSTEFPQSTAYPFINSGQAQRYTPGLRLLGPC